MLSFLQEKTSIAEAFEVLKPCRYGNRFTIKDVVFEIATDDVELSNYMAETYQGFLTLQNADYTFRLHKSTKRLKINKDSDTEYLYSFIRFFDTFFYYRYHKHAPIVDVLLPKRC